MVGWRNPARYLAPLALVGAAIATYAVVHSALHHNQAASRPPVVQTAPTRPRSGQSVSARKSKFYVVQPNDTLSRIASRTGVSLSTLEALNPSVNPNTLHPGQRLRLRQ
jgi:LysM repeat protein